MVGFYRQRQPNLICAYGGRVRHIFRMTKTIAADLSIPAAQRLADRFQVRYIEPDAAAFPLDQTVPWGITRIMGGERCPFATWDISTGSSQTVAVLDTGIEQQHPQLPRLAGATNTVDDTPPDRDDTGHGTHVAGTVAAKAFCPGVTGAAPGVRLYSVKVLGRMGIGSISSVAAGIEWAAERNLGIINMSLGTTRFSRTLQDTCQAAFRKGSMLVAAAGNRGADMRLEGEVTYPARFESVIAVAASDRCNRRAAWSSRGRDVELIAPGVDITSTVPPENFTSRSGTSMAAAHVSAAAALTWSAQPSLDNRSLRNLLRRTAQNVNLPPRQQGFGLVRADLAVRKAASMQI